MKTVPVYYVTNNDMIGYTATSVSSLLSNSKSYIELYLLDCGLSDYDRRNFLNLKKTYSNLKEVNFAKVDLDQFQGLNTWYYGSRDAWAMLLFPNLFPEFHGKIIHLESDTLILNDINVLFNIDLGNYYFGACPEIAMPDQTRGGLFPNKKHVYFNLGMALYDVDQWRKNNVTEICLNYGKQYGKKFFCLHQDALNLFFWGNNYKIIDNKFNLGQRKNYIKKYLPEYDDEYFRREWSTPFIVHYSPNKPWRTDRQFYFHSKIASYFNDWWFYATKTPYFYGLFLSFVSHRIEDAIAGLRNNTNLIGNSMLDTLPDDNPFRNVLGEGIFLNRTLIDRNAVVANCKDPNNHLGSDTKNVTSLNKRIKFKLFCIPVLDIWIIQPYHNMFFKLFRLIPLYKIKFSKKRGYVHKLFYFIPVFIHKTRMF